MSTSTPHPVRIVVTDDLRRSRLTVFFRLLLAIPHYFWAGLLGSAVFIGVFVNWWILLVRGKTPDGLHEFVAGYLRYATHVEAYMLIAANPYPAFYPFDDKPYPVDLEIDPPAKQSRWKTFFRFPLAIPAIMIGSTLLWGGPRNGSYFAGGLAFTAAFLLWWVGVFRARGTRGLRDLVVYCIGYASQLSCYLFLLTDRYPYSGPNAFVPGAEGPTAPPVARRWVVEASRVDGQMLVLTLVVLGDDGAVLKRRSERVQAALVPGELAIGSPLPDGIVQIDPEAAPAPPAPSRADEPPHAVRMTVTDDLRRSRMLVLFRLPISIPHIVWAAFWTILVVPTSLLNWLCTLVLGRPPRPFHRFLSAYLRYTTHLTAFLFLVGNQFPGFVGKPGSYPVDLELPQAEPQRRVVTFFRLFLAVPAFLVAGGAYGALFTVGFLGWFAALFRGRMPDGLRNLGAYALRYGGQVNAYAYLVTSRYPDAGPRPDPASP